MKSLRYGIFATLLFLPLATFASESPCDNSVITIRNSTNTLFNINDYTPRSDTKLTMVQGPAEIPPGGKIQFKVHSGVMTWGESLGVIKLQGRNREYKLFYTFSSFFGYGDCNVSHDVTTNRFDFDKEKYLFNCEDGPIKSPASLICTINTPDDDKV